MTYSDDINRTKCSRDYQEYLEYRVTALEKNYDKMDNKIDLLLQNHIPHIQTELAALKTRVAVTTVINVGAILSGLLLNKYL